MIQYNLGAQAAVSSALALSTQINGRVARRDTEDALTVETTGGSVLYFTPGINVLIQRSLNRVVNLQIPAYQHLDGSKKEKADGAGLKWDII